MYALHSARSYVGFEVHIQGGHLGPGPVKLPGAISCNNCQDNDHRLIECSKCWDTLWESLFDSWLTDYL